MAAKFSCAFCETTAADDYEYVQQLFHRTVREVRKERERTVASNAIDDELANATLPSAATFPSPSSSSSSNSSIHLSTANEIDKAAAASNIPLPPPMPATLAHKAARATQPSTGSLPISSSVKLGSLPSIGSVSTSLSKTPQPTPATAKRTPSKSSSVFAKIFK